MNYKDLYDQMYSEYPTYNNHYPNEPRFYFAFSNIDLSLNLKVLDLGTGKGTLYKELIKLPNLKVDAADLNQYGDFPIIQLNITNQEEWSNIEQYDVIFCLDVLEHILEEDLDVVLSNIAKHSKYSILTTANHDDDPGQPILHVTKEKLPFWQEKISKYFSILKIENYSDIWYNFVCSSK